MILWNQYKISVFIPYIFTLRDSDLMIVARVDPSKSLALYQDKNTFHAMYPEDKKGNAENWISK